MIAETKLPAVDQTKQLHSEVLTLADQAVRRKDLAERDFLPHGGFYQTGETIENPIPHATARRAGRLALLIVSEHQTNFALPATAPSSREI